MSKESDLQVECNTLLDDNNVFYHHRERGGHEKRLAHDGGLPDLIIWFGTVCTFVELKMPGKKLDEDQEKFRDKAIKNGFDYYVIENFHQFEVLMDDIGIIDY